jgi:hypothetical protein
MSSVDTGVDNVDGHTGAGGTVVDVCVSSAVPVRHMG